MLRRHAVVFNTIADAVIILDSTAIITDANPAATTILGFSTEELVGSRPTLWQWPEEADIRRREVMAALEACGAWIGEYPIVRKDGATRIVESRVRSVVDADGRPIQTIAVMRDVTDQRRLEGRLLQAQKLEAIGSLGAGIAHEINSPLQSVAGNARFLDDGVTAVGRVLECAQAVTDAVRTTASLEPLVAEFDEAVARADLPYLHEELPRAAKQAIEGCSRASEIIQALIRFSAPASADKTLTDINATIRDALAVSRNEWKYVATATSDLDPALPHVPCLSAELKQVILSLIVNAAQAIEESRTLSDDLGHIIVSTREHGDVVEIRVTDDGPGIPAAIQSRIFDPFFTTKDPGRGKGQNLSIGYATIVGKHRGTFTVESVVGQGASFVIRLPRDTERSISAAA